MRKARLLGAAALAWACGCATAGTAPNASTPWTPPASVRLPPSHPAPTHPQLPPGFSLEHPPKEVQLSVAQVVDIALQNNPRTREVWFQARAQAEQVGVSRAQWWPTLDFVTDLTRQHQPFAGGVLTVTLAQATPTLALNWLLLDFGGRSGRISESEHLLLAADFSQNQALQDVVWQVEQSYIQYLDAKALLDVQEATIRSAQASLDAAKSRLEAGVATEADVLQAATALARAQLDRATIQGQLDTVKGALATAMGLPANLPVEVGLLPADVPVQPVTSAVESFIERALSGRADLAAAKARELAAADRIGQARSAYFPTVSLSANFSRYIFIQRDTSGGGSGGGGSLGGGNAGCCTSANAYAATLDLRVPLFTGFSTVHDVQRTRELEDAAKAQVEEMEQSVVLQVWSAYANLRTAVARIASAKALLDSAQRSFEVNRGRYQEGVGNILDLLSAQSQLASARAEEVQARSNWFLALGQLAYASGVLEPPKPGESPLPAMPGAQPPPQPQQQEQQQEQQQAPRPAPGAQQQKGAP